MILKYWDWQRLLQQYADIKSMQTNIYKIYANSCNFANSKITGIS